MRRRLYLKIHYSVSVIIFLYSFLSCTPPLYIEEINENTLKKTANDLDEKDQQCRYVTIKILGNDWQIDTYVITATNPDEAEPVIMTITENEAVLVLKVGFWEIAVDALDANDNILYQGVKNFEITTEDMTVNIILFKKAGNLVLTIKNQSGCTVKPGDPREIKCFLSVAGKGFATCNKKFKKGIPGKL